MDQNNKMNQNPMDKMNMKQINKISEAMSGILTGVKEKLLDAVLIFDLLKTWLPPND